MDYPSLIINTGTALILLTALVLSVIIIVKKRRIQFVNDRLELTCLMLWGMFLAILVISLAFKP